MESGNISSPQSSSGGDEQAKSNSTFLGPHVGLLPHHPSHSHPPMASSPPCHDPFPPLSSFFDPLSCYLDAFVQSPPPSVMANSNSLLNFDMSWAAGVRALGNSNFTDCSGLLGTSLPPRHSPNGDPKFEGGIFTGAAAAINALPLPSSSLQLRHPPPAAHQLETPHAAVAPVRNSWKHSMASRWVPQQASTSHGGTGSVGPLIAVLAVITILGVVVGLIGPLCARSIFGHGHYDLVGWIERKCTSYIDGRIDPPPPPPSSTSTNGGMVGPVPIVIPTSTAAPTDKPQPAEHGEVARARAEG